MAETPKKTVALNAAKIGGIAAFVPLVLNTLPEPYGSIISCVIIACGAIQAAVPAPVTGSYWVLPYRVMSVVALNVGWAINHVAGRDCVEFCAVAFFSGHRETVFEHDGELASDSIPLAH